LEDKMFEDHTQQLEGTSVVVTGGARGLGQAMVRALAASGASVLVVDIDEEPIVETVAETEGTVVGHRADISVKKEVEEVVDHCVSTFGSIDVIINNAGIGMTMIQGPDRYANPLRFWDLEDSWVQRFFEIHVMAPFYLTKAALPHMRAGEFGRIVTVTTSLSTMLSSGNAPYGTMKASSEALCSAMAKDLEGSAVTANILIPGGGANTRYVPDRPNVSRDDLIQPVVMGPPAVFLASTESAQVNGRRITAKFWDPAKTSAENLERASTPIGWPHSH
jgi:NAD(P)-dependent dehydrogenase (short-subunit alcohol dehydrogenase family)